MVDLCVDPVLSLHRELRLSLRTDWAGKIPGVVQQHCKNNRNAAQARRRRRGNDAARNAVGRGSNRRLMPRHDPVICWMEATWTCYWSQWYINTPFQYSLGTTNRGNNVQITSIDLWTKHIFKTRTIDGSKMTTNHEKNNVGITYHDLRPLSHLLQNKSQNQMELLTLRPNCEIMHWSWLYQAEANIFAKRIIESLNNIAFFNAIHISTNAVLRDSVVVLSKN